MLKFGGAALRDGPAVESAVAIVRAHGGPRPLVVVSAHEGVTKLLERAAEDARAGGFDWEPLRVRHRTLLRQLGLSSELLDRHLRDLRAILEHVRSEGRLDRRRLDFVLSFGERMSARVVAAALRAGGVPATPVDAFDLGLLSETRSGLTLPVEGARARVRRAVLDVPGVPVVTGFVALDAEGHLTTLGPNGSDLTAVWMGEAVDADEVHLWKTVDGVRTADPKLVPDARRIARLTYREAAELAAHGADVLHAAAMEPASRRGIPIRVRNAEDPALPGTVIAGEAGDSHPPGPRAIAHRARVALLSRRLDLARDPGEQMNAVFSACREAGLDPFLFAVPGTEAVLLLPDKDGVERLGAGDVVERGLASFALVGPGVGEDAELVAAVCDLAARARLDVRSLPSGDGPMSRLFLAPAEKLETTLRLVHGTFIGEERERREARPTRA